MALREKLRDDKKKLAEAQARAAQKGPMGELSSIIINKSYFIHMLIYIGGSGIKKSKK